MKTEFGRFGGVLDKVRQQLATASRTIEQTGVRTRAMERTLRNVEKLPAEGATALFAVPPAGAAEPATDEEEAAGWDDADDSENPDADEPNYPGEPDRET